MEESEARVHFRVIRFIHEAGIIFGKLYLRRNTSYKLEKGARIWVGGLEFKIRFRV